MSFKVKIFLSLLLAAAVPVLVACILMFNLVAGSYVKSHNEDLLTIACTNGSSLSELVKVQARGVSLASKRHAVIEFLKDGGAQSSEYKADVEEIVSSLVNSEQIYDDAVVMDEKGIVVLANDTGNIGMDLTAYSFFTAASQSSGTYVSDMTMSILDKGKRVIAFSHGVTDQDGKFLGAVALMAGADFLQQFITGINLIGGEISFVMDSAGVIVSHPDSRYIGVSNAQSPLGSLAADYMQEKTPKYGQRELKTESANRLVSYYILDDIHWVLVVQHSSEKILPARKSAGVTAFVTFAGLLIFAAILSFMLAGKLSEPVGSITKALALAAKDEYAPCSVNDKGELGRAANDYNSMLDSLKKKYEKIGEEAARNQYHAFHDTVTDLLNWEGYLEELKNTLASTAFLGVLFIDLDDFKNINDTYGRSTGDIILKQISERLASPELDLTACARTGGDEFYLIKKGAQYTVSETAKKILAALESPFIEGGITTYVSASIGIAMYPEDGAHAAVLSKNAELAMYKAKNSGKNRFLFFGNKMKEEIFRKSLIVDILRSCIENKTANLLYQPVVDLDTNRIKSFEALMRITDERAGTLYPDEFIPIAEACGLISKIGKWTLETACAFAKKLCDDGKDFGVISVNISDMQIKEKTFVADVISILKKTGLDPKYLQLEITESMFFHHAEENKNKLAELRAFGITIALDDFGESYASLNSLTTMPIDVVKIDKCYIDDVANENGKANITLPIIQMSHDIGLRVIAEGVEQSAQLSELGKQNCDMFQGLLFSKPVTPEEAEMLIEKTL